MPKRYELAHAVLVGIGLVALDEGDLEAVIASAPDPHVVHVDADENGFQQALATLALTALTI
jgi:hypothetical protein